jgi:hypothetical protein
MYVNGKMRPVETSRNGGKGAKENDGGGEFNYDIRTFVNVTMYFQYNNIVKKIVSSLKYSLTSMRTSHGNSRFACY